jgi:hypothetical protein
MADFPLAFIPASARTMIAGRLASKDKAKYKPSKWLVLSGRAIRHCRASANLRNSVLQR